MQRRWVVLVALSSILVIVISGMWAAYRNVQQVRNGYGEWALAEMIIAYAEDHARVPPKSWAELDGYDLRAAHLIKSWDLSVVRNKFNVNFSALQTLSDGATRGKVPQIISATTGHAIDLGGAQPNAMLAEYFSTGKVPERVSICGRWTRSHDGNLMEWVEFD